MIISKRNYIVDETIRAGASRSGARAAGAEDGGDQRMSETSVTQRSPAREQSRPDDLRRTSLGMSIALLVQYALGMWVSLYATVPKRDHGGGLPGALERARGPRRARRPRPDPRCRRHRSGGPGHPGQAPDSHGDLARQPAGHRRGGRQRSRVREYRRQRRLPRHGTADRGGPALPRGEPVYPRPGTRQRLKRNQWGPDQTGGWSGPHHDIRTR